MRNEIERPFDAMQIQCSFILTNKWKFNGIQYSNEVGKVIRAHMALVCIMTQPKLLTVCRSMYNRILKHDVELWTHYVIIFFLLTRKLASTNMYYVVCTIHVQGALNSESSHRIHDKRNAAILQSTKGFT